MRPALLCLRTALMASVMLLFVLVQPVRADNFYSHCTIYSSTAAGPYTVPSGLLCLRVFGDGTYISNMDAKWYSVELCNWRIDWVIYYNGKTWWRNNGPAHNECDNIHGTRIRSEGYAPAGSDLCAELYHNASGVRIDSA